NLPSTGPSGFDPDEESSLIQPSIIPINDRIEPGTRRPGTRWHSLMRVVHGVATTTWRHTRQEHSVKLLTPALQTGQARRFSPDLASMLRPVSEAGVSKRRGAEPQGTAAPPVVAVVAGLEINSVAGLA